MESRALKYPVLSIQQLHDGFGEQARVVPHHVGLADEVAGESAIPRPLDAVNVRLHENGAGLAVFFEKFLARSPRVDQGVVEKAHLRVPLDGLDMVESRETVCLAGLRHDVTDID